MSYRIEKGYGGFRVIDEDTGVAVNQGLDQEQAEALLASLSPVEEAPKSATVLKKAPPETSDK